MCQTTGNTATAILDREIQLDAIQLMPLKSANNWASGDASYPPRGRRAQKWSFSALSECNEESAEL